MEFFEEIYSSYFQAVRKILLDSRENTLSKQEMEEICRNYASSESALTILPKLLNGAWSSLLKEPVESDLKLPLTSIQKSWLKALLMDRRFRLFFPKESLSILENELSEISPLYETSCFHYFDRYTDGDPYESEQYHVVFRTILKSMLEHRPLIAAYEGEKGFQRTLELLPCQLQYSPKNDKFRLLAVSMPNGYPHKPYILNVARIQACHLSKNDAPEQFDWDYSRFQKQAAEPVRIRISNERNALERCMLHFANYEKHTVYEPETDSWVCSIYYDPSDETELLIELLSFGPVIRILGPENFLTQVRRRVKRQHELFYGEIPDKAGENALATLKIF